MKSSLSLLPSVDLLLAEPPLAALGAEHGHGVVTHCARQELAAVRAAARAGGSVPGRECLVDAVAARVADSARPRLRRVFNLTGTVLHTNLGRASLPDEAVAAMVVAARHPCALEYDIEEGGRGDRDKLVSGLLCEQTGAAAATVTNNNAAAVFLILNTLALRREVIVSRGELIEIGGSFRLPDIMQRAGARLVEVGTTNRTHAADYAAAITPRTAMILKVHPSNFAIRGFTHAVPEDELAALARERALPLAVDLGSGTLARLERYGLPHEPTPGQSITAGADLVSFSGDKLLGGPQCGLIVGRANLVARLKKNPLARALRADKIRLAGLEAVLRLYRDSERLPQRLITLRQLTRSEAEICAAAVRLLPALRAALQGWPVDVEVTPLQSQVGSGSLPLERLRSAGYAVRPRGRARGGTLQRLARALHALAQPVLGRIEDGALRLDLRCLGEDEEHEFAAALTQLPADAGTAPSAATTTRPRGGASNARSSKGDEHAAT